MTSFIAARGSGRSTSFTPAVPAAWAVTTIAFIGYLPVSSSCLLPGRSVKFLGESDETPFRPADVAESISVLIPDYVAHELCAALSKPAKRLVDIVHGEHDAEVV